MVKYWHDQKYPDCLGKYNLKEGKVHPCSWCTRETQDDCREYAEIMKNEAEGR